MAETFSTNIEPPHYAVITYNNKISQRIKNMQNKYSIVIALRKFSSLGRHVKKNNTKVDRHKKSSVYKFISGTCSKTNVGTTHSFSKTKKQSLSCLTD